jgi:hypothetical protein
MPKPTPLGEQPLFAADRHALGARNQLAELGEVLLAAGRSAGEFLSTAAGCHELPPCRLELRPAAKLILADESIENLELMRGTREAALLELAGHREEPLDEARQVFARDRPPPRVRPRATVREHAARGDQTLLARRPQLGDRIQGGVFQDPVGEVELGLDVGLVRTRTQVRGVARDSEEETDRLRQDRLAGAGLPGDRVQPRREREVRLPDEDEALDAETAKQGDL